MSVAFQSLLGYSLAVATHVKHETTPKLWFGSGGHINFVMPETALSVLSTRLLQWKLSRIDHVSCIVLIRKWISYTRQISNKPSTWVAACQNCTACSVFRFTYTCEITEHLGNILLTVVMDVQMICILAGTGGMRRLLKDRLSTTDAHGSHRSSTHSHLSPSRL